MKTAFLLREDELQIVLTPENDWERNILGQVSENVGNLSAYNGSFFDCRGGYTRFSYSQEPYSDRSYNSLILRILPKDETE